jgi:hypothetical protein
MYSYCSFFLSGSYRNAEVVRGSCADYQNYARAWASLPWLGPQETHSSIELADKRKLLLSIFHLNGANSYRQDFPMVPWVGSIISAKRAGELISQPRKGDLRRVPDQGDRRQTRILLTEKSRGINARYLAVSAQMTEIFYHGINLPEIEQFETTLQNVLNNLKEYEG